MGEINVTTEVVFYGAFRLRECVTPGSNNCTMIVGMTRKDSSLQLR